MLVPRPLWEGSSGGIASLAADDSSEVLMVRGRTWSSDTRVGWKKKGKNQDFAVGGVEKERKESGFQGEGRT